MKIGLLRTIVLCGACAAIAGAGSAALAADEDDPGTGAAPGKPAGHSFTMRTCVKGPAGEGNKSDNEGEEHCTVTSGDGPPPGGEPSFGGCAVRVERGTSDKPVDDAAAKKKMAAIAKEKCHGEPPFGGCMKAEPGPGDKATDAAAAKAKKAAIAAEKAAGAT
jgi:hypothetical protein